jgi:hypothetical protein
LRYTRFRDPASVSGTAYGFWKLAKPSDPLLGLVHRRWQINVESAVALLAA